MFTFASTAGMDSFTIAANIICIVACFFIGMFAIYPYTNGFRRALFWSIFLVVADFTGGRGSRNLTFSMQVVPGLLLGIVTLFLFALGSKADRA